MTIKKLHEVLSKLLKSDSGWDSNTEIKMFNNELDDWEELELEECCDNSFILEFKSKVHK